MDKNFKNIFIKNLNEISINSEKIEYEIHTLVSSIQNSIKFEIVIRNNKGEIVSVGKTILDDKLKNEIKLLDNKDLQDFNYPIFFILKKSQKIFLYKSKMRIHNESSTEFHYTFNDFFDILKNEDNSIMLESDKKCKDLELSIIELNKSIRELETSILDLKALNLKIANERDLYEETYLQTIEKKDKLIEKYKKKETERINSEIRFLNEKFDLMVCLSKIKKPKSSTIYSETRYGTGVNDIQKNIFSESNMKFEYKFGILSKRLLLRIDIYDYYSKGRVDLPSYELSESNYYIFDSVNKVFEIDKNEYYKDVILWLDKEKINL